MTLDSICNKLVDFIGRKLEINRQNYMRLTNALSGQIPSTVHQLNNLQNYPTGIDLAVAFRCSAICIRFGRAMIDKKIKFVILIDLKYSGFEKCDGRYVIHTMKRYRLTDNQTDTNDIYHVEYCYKIFQRLPNYWHEMSYLARCQFD